MATKLLFGSGTPAEPHVTTVPFDFNPTEKFCPPATATKSALGDGRLHWPLPLSPHATTEPFVLRPSE